MPMHLWLDAGGRIVSAGPTLRRLFAGRAVEGQGFFDRFRVIRPGPAAGMAALRALAGERLHLSLASPPHTAFRGLALPAAPATGGAADAVGGEGVGMLLNLSFGIRVAEAVRDHALTDADFAPTDLAVEMLYLVEAKSAVMTEIKALNLRLQAARQAAEAQALTDPLTGLANRRALELALADAVAAAVAGGPAFALAHLDLDHFKAVNDTLGHGAGDAVLADVARALAGETRKADLAARIGGDEFVLILKGQTDPDRLAALARRLIARLETPVAYAGAPCRISASIGMVRSCDYPRPEAERMLTDADRALYASKHGGRGRATLICPGGSAPDDRRRGHAP